jgi:hypothetical protein
MLSNREPALSGPYPRFEDVDPIPALSASTKARKLGIPNNFSGLQGIDRSGRYFDLA